ncbi:Protein TIC 62, chloroplastic, variant 3 [Trifolium repens]|nr:Protein TIC 62, chloroplastic, variant 3 [Trifolium repens]
MPMDVFSVTSTTIPSSLIRKDASADKPSTLLNLSKYSHFMKYPLTTIPCKNRIRCNSIRAQASSGSTKSSTVEGIPEKKDSKDDNLVFVAGATGKVGSRTVRELIKLGFSVRAGVRNAQRASALVQSVKQLKLDATSGGNEAVEKLEIVECDLEKPNQIGPALGNASTVICTIGASEKEIFDVTGPFRIDYQATKNLVDAATVAKVNHFILVTSLGTNKFGFPAAILNLFWGVLCWKRKAEEALLASGLPYTIVRPGGMERPTDAYKETHNVTLSTEDTLFGGQVSNLQVAELMAAMAKNRDLSYCKIVEVIAETTAPLTPAEKLLAKIPSQRPYIYPPKKEPEQPKPGTPAVSDPSPSADVVAEVPIISPEKEPEQSKPNTTAVSDPSPSADVVEEVPIISHQKETEQPKPVVNQPLSPYTAYADLKPPSSPYPSKPSDKKQIKISDAVPTPSSSDTPSSIPAIDGISQTISSSKKKDVLSPYAAYEDLKPPTSPTPRQSSSKDKPLTASTVVEPVSGVYIFSYADLKPPSSPSPSKPSDEKQIKISDAVPTPSSSDIPSSIPAIDGISQTISSTKRKDVLSPYAAYEDLKPPTSPTPRQSSSSDKPLTASTVVEPVSPSIEETVAEKSPSQDSTSSNSPYHVYADFKPPSSPSPSAPITLLSTSSVSEVPKIDAVSTNGPAQPSVEDKPKDDGQQLNEPKSRPLSPYAMYEDLKPPASPSPSFRKS